MIIAGDIMSEEVVVIYDDMLMSQVAHLMLRDRVEYQTVSLRSTDKQEVLTEVSP